MLRDLLLKFFDRLKTCNIAYCVIGNYDGLPDYTENDVDIWVDDFVAAEKILHRTAKELFLKLYLHNKTANGSNNYFYFNRRRQPVEIVKIDLMIETAYKSLVPIVNGKLIEKNRTVYKNFLVVDEVLEGIMHLLYPLVSFGIVRDKYKEKIYKLNEVDKFQHYLESIVGQKYCILLGSLIKDNNWHGIEMMSGSIKRCLIVKMFAKIDVLRIRIFFRFLRSIFSRGFRRNGIVICFTGIDGAGKTSIKEYMIKNSNKYFTKNKCQEFYWRPFLLPRIARLLGTKGQKEEVDGSGKRVVRHSLFTNMANLLKYIYYVLDFILGQVKYFIPLHTGGLVLFDRYHFDNIIYPERFGFKVSKKLMLFFDRHIIPQPDIMFYLNASADTLYERKHEIDLGEINTQQALYAGEIKGRKDTVEISTDGSFDDSVNEVLKKCFARMSRRYGNNG